MKPDEIFPFILTEFAKLDVLHLAGNYSYRLALNNFRVGYCKIRIERGLSNAEITSLRRVMPRDVILAELLDVHCTATVYAVLIGKSMVSWLIEDFPIFEELLYSKHMESMDKCIAEWTESGLPPYNGLEEFISAREAFRIFPTRDSYIVCLKEAQQECPRLMKRLKSGCFHIPPSHSWWKCAAIETTTHIRGESIEVLQQRLDARPPCNIQ